MSEKQAKAWQEGYKFGRLMQFDADWVNAPKWPRHNSRKSLERNLEAFEGMNNHDNPYLEKK